MLPEEPLNSSVKAMSNAEVVLVVGTSALVHPAASLPLVAKQAGALVIEVNMEETPLSSMADVTLLGPSAVRLPELLQAAGIG